MNENNELSIITEVGTFGSLNIDDPTVKKVKKKNKDLSEAELNEAIREAIMENSNIVNI